MLSNSEKYKLSHNPGFTRVAEELNEVSKSAPGLVDNILAGEDLVRGEYDLSIGLLIELKELSDSTGLTIEKIIEGYIEGGIREDLKGKKSEEEFGQLFFGFTVKKFENIIMDYVDNNKPYTGGTEADIYKFKLPGEDKELVIIKEEFSNTGKKEFKNHKTIKKIEEEFNKENNSSIFVPNLIHQFNKGGTDYIIMECVNGKTFELMASEAILEQETIHRGTEIKSIDNKKEFYYYFYRYINNGKEILEENDFKLLSINKILELIADEDGYLKDINFNSDEEGREALLETHRLLKHDGLKVKHNPDGLVHMGGDKYMNELTHNIIHRSDLSKIGIFTEKEKKEITIVIKKFILYMHNKGFYHADLGENGRNIMFEKTNTGYKVFLIDFGKSKINYEAQNYSFEELNEQIYNYNTRDENMVNILEGTGIYNGKNKIKLIDKEKDSIIDNLLQIGKKLSISENQIRAKFIFQEKRIKNSESKIKIDSYFKEVSNLLLSRTKGGYELNLSKTNKKEIQNDRDLENDIIKSEILVLLSFLDKNNLLKLKNYVNNLDLKVVKVAKTSEYKKLYNLMIDNLLFL